MSGVVRKAERTTIYDVAALAGVSIATVSHVLNRPERVSATTREKVLQAVDELDFTPKQTAVSLARKGVGRIAVVGPFSAYPSYFTRLLGILHECEADRIEVVVFDDDESDDRSPLLSSMPATGRIDGLVLMGVEPDEEVALRLTQRGIPTVLLDRASDTFTSIAMNDEMGGRLAAEHLVDTGGRRFAFVSPPKPRSAHITSGELRLRGYTEALVAAGFSEPTWVIADDSVDGGRAAAAELLALPEPPDSVLAVHDLMATGVLRGIREGGRVVPDDVRVVGYDDTPLASAVDLTTVHQPFVESGQLAARAILLRLQDPTAPVQRIVLNPELVVRGSA